jgi:hypothetical protein
VQIRSPERVGAAAAIRTRNPALHGPARITGTRRVSDIGARDPIEAMLAVQMVATHEAALECFRRAALTEQTFAGRELGLKYGDKLVRSFAALTDALNRHRARASRWSGSMHVTVQAGGYW